MKSIENADITGASSLADEASKWQSTDIVGILGGGQLAKMLAIEAYRLGLRIAIIDKEANTPAGDMTKLDFSKGWDNKNELDRFINACDIVTLENEFISPDILEYINKYKAVFPAPSTMKLIQDKYIQKTTLAEHNIAIPEFDKVDSIDDLFRLGLYFGYPFVVKTRTLGYDGYGNMTINNRNDGVIAWDKFNNGSSNDGKLMVEKFVNFKMEIAVMVARSKIGEMKTYPCVQTIQKDHICHKVIAPVQIDIDLAMQAQELAEKTILAVNGVGVFGVEMFLTNDNKILVNEIAPRPHNSGHYTIEACKTSQYENAIRAILGLPLGSTEMICKTAIMKNILGEADSKAKITINDMGEILKQPDTTLHLYNKKQTRKGRKMGHFTTRIWNATTS